MDQKTINTLINAMERAKAHNQELKMKWEDKLWKQVDEPYRLIDALPMLTKDELDNIRKKLELSGVSTLKKAELAVELARVIPTRFEKALLTFDKERYELIKKIIKNDGVMPVDDQFPRIKIKSLRDHGIVYPVLKDGEKHLMVPVELIDSFAEIDQDKMQESIRQNTEWILLVHGMIYYYGAMESSKVLDKIEDFTKGEVDIRKYYDVIAGASDYYRRIRILPYSYGGYITNDSILKVESIIKEHKARPDIPYYPFTKIQLLKAGESGFVDKSPEMVKFLRFLSEAYDLTVKEKDEIAEQLIYLINTDSQPAKLLEYLQSILEIPSLEFFEQVTAFIMEVYNHTRMWALKGYFPIELRKEREKHTKAEPVFPLNQPKNASNVIDLTTKKKAGRNDPCPCGSGEKYKKCCGK
ncbi:SEC-C metal-binding domain-containing protein [Heyndrickxia sp. MSNUG]|uniref:YecA family protein n=1 Tax=Heyndrickxia sp. MSNUG TaxID=3136677 RepID=UPI003C2C21C7